MNIKREALLGMIDHTLLKPDATAEAVLKLCAEAREYGFYAVCVNPYFAPIAAKALSGSKTRLCVVIGFPLGANSTRIKVAEAKEAVANGASEVDMVICVSALKDGDHDYVYNDIRSTADAIRGKAILKVIIETCFLTDEEKRTVCGIAVRAGADYVKTSTGFGSGGATAADVALMRQEVGPDIGVKASGGIKTLDDALAMIAAGASRLGTSSGIKILAEYDGRNI